MGEIIFFLTYFIDPRICGNRQYLTVIKHPPKATEIPNLVLYFPPISLCNFIPYIDIKSLQFSGILIIFAPFGRGSRSTDNILISPFCRRRSTARSTASGKAYRCPSDTERKSCYFAPCFEFHFLSFPSSAYLPLSVRLRFIQASWMIFPESSSDPRAARRPPASWTGRHRAISR